jgi:class 3 adenylate cyclase
VSILYREGAWSARQSQYVAQQIEGSRLIPLPGNETLFLSGEMDPVLDAIETCVTGGVTARDDDRVLATVMFTDVVDSTEQLARQGDRRWMTTLATHDMVVRQELAVSRGREVKMTGDGFLATFDGPGRAVRCAAAIRDALLVVGIDVRIGLHVGEVELRGDDVSGIAVHIAQRVQSTAAPGEILATSTVRDLVAGSGIAFEDRGTRALRGIPDQWHVYAAHP